MKSKSLLEGYTFFLDRNFGRFQIATALREDGLTVEVHYDHFPDAEAGELDDRYWIADVTSRGWVIFTRNGEIRRNPLERAAFIQARARVFNIRNANASAQDVRTCIRLTSRKIARILRTRRGPFIAGVSLLGDVTFIEHPPA